MGPHHLVGICGQKPLTSFFTICTASLHVVCVSDLGVRVKQARPLSVVPDNLSAIVSDFQSPCATCADSAARLYSPFPFCCNLRPEARPQCITICTVAHSSRIAQSRARKKDKSSSVAFLDLMSPQSAGL